MEKFYRMLSRVQKGKRKLDSPSAKFKRSDGLNLHFRGLGKVKL